MGGLKAEVLGSFLPASQNKGAKFNLHFKQANFHGRAFFDLLKGPTANVDAVIGQDGFLAGASAGYDVQKAAITSYSAAVGYVAPQYTASVTAANNLSVSLLPTTTRLTPKLRPVLRLLGTPRAETKSVSRLPASTDWTPSHSPRSRSTTVVSPLSPTTFSSALVSPLASEPPLIPKSSTKLPTRSVPPSSSTHRLRMREDLGIGPYSTIDGDKTVPAEFA